MDGLFDSLNDLFHNDWINGFQDQYGFDLSDDMIADSVHQASEFYNMCDPALVVEWDTTAVALNDPCVHDDDILLFNREQMSSLGITDKEGFDLVLTHEIGHRELQSMGNVTGFNPYQEELCCDYMVGVRAGLNDMDVSKITEALSDMEAGKTHPDGALRVQAVKDGMRFAQEYKDANCCNPTFGDCLEHFEQTDVCISASDIGVEFESFPKSFIDDAAWHYKKAETYDNEAKYYEKKADNAASNGDFKSAKDYANTAKSYAHHAAEERKIASTCTK